MIDPCNTCEYPCDSSRCESCPYNPDAWDIDKWGENNQ